MVMIMTTTSINGPGQTAHFYPLQAFRGKA
jgi:hypothetical protein